MIATPFLGAVVSGALLLGLITLFRFEDARGRRLFGSARARFDALLARTAEQVAALGTYIGAGAARETTHYLFHTMLKFLLRCVQRAETRIASLIRSNKKLARKVRSEGDTPSALDEIVEHKAATALSDEEKRRKREETLEG